MAATASPHSSAGYGAMDSLPTSPLLPAEDQDDTPPPRKSASEYLFKYLILVQVCMYLEAGAVPSLLQQFTLTFHLSPQEQGLLGAVVYIAISLASPWCSTLFRRFCPRTLLGVSLVVNNLAVLIFACAPTRMWFSKALLVSLRGCIGLTQAFSCVYSPLWVHDYAPKAKRASWMSYLQGAVPVGITLGYFAGSVTLWLSEHVPNIASLSMESLQRLTLAQSTSDTPSDLLDSDDSDDMSLCQGIYCWRWPFLVQFTLIAPLSVLLFFVPREHIRLRSTRRRSIVIVDADEDDDADVETGSSMASVCADESMPLSERRSRRFSSEPQSEPENLSRWSNLWLLLQHKVYVFIVMGLSALFFVVAGVQFWTTLYLETNTQDSMYLIHLSYLLVSGTGPIMGVFFGGWLIDQFGGYSGPYHQMQALRVCMALGFAGCLASLPVSYVHNTFYIAVFLWLMLFCGGSILPACSGIVISAAPPRLRPLASSVAYASYNLFGYAASNYVPGLIMNFIIDPRADADSNDEMDGSSGTVTSCNAACTYRIGFRIVLFWSIWAFFCLFCGAMASARNYAATGAANDQEDAVPANGKRLEPLSPPQPVFKSVV